MTQKTISALVVCHNEEQQLAQCLEPLKFADQIVVVLDRCTDRSADIARSFGATTLEGAWPIEGDRRNAGIDACTSDWIVEVDCDERMSSALAKEIQQIIQVANPGYFLIPFDNYIGEKLVRYGWGASWGVMAAPRLFSKGAKRWGPQRIHPSLELLKTPGGERRLVEPMKHYVDKDISDMIRRLDRYTKAKADDLVASGDIGSLGNNIRRFFSRFYKCYVRRKGYREGLWGFLIALMAALFPILSYLRAKLEG